MSKRTLCSILGLWVAIVPFFGLPGDWKRWIITVSGLVIALISYIHAKKNVIQDPTL
ncbi:MAG: hypothetical protein V4664_00215 [Patescibacteria group bacterium]